MTRPGHRRRRRRLRILSILDLRCEEASELISQRLEEPGPLIDRLALAGHLLVCVACRRFAHQARFLREVCYLRPAAARDLDAARPDILSDEARARILAALRDAPGGGGPDRSGAAPR